MLPIPSTSDSAPDNQVTSGNPKEGKESQASLNTYSKKTTWQELVFSKNKNKKEGREERKVGGKKRENE